MAEYRALREQHTLLEICATPDLATEVTLQPIRRIEVDAAILFSDLLLPLAPMGLPFDFIKGEGPQIEHPIDSPADIDKLKLFEPREALGHVLEAIELVQHELNGRVPLIGFSGAPFTLASYAIEGGHSNNFARTKSLMYGHPDAWHRLCDKFATVVADYLVAQIDAGVDAVQLFDSWVGTLSPADYREFTRCPIRRRFFQAIARTGPSRFISAPGHRPFSRRCAKPAETSSASTGASRSTKHGSRSDLDRSRAGQSRSDAAPRSAATHARPGGRRAHTRRRPSGSHLQPRPWHPAVDASRERADACAVRASGFAPRALTSHVLVHAAPLAMPASCAGSAVSDVLVIGGGIAGLFAAAHTKLQRAVAESTVRLLEASRSAGRRSFRPVCTVRGLDHRRRPRLDARAETRGRWLVPRARHRRPPDLNTHSAHRVCPARRAAPSDHGRIVSRIPTAPRPGWRAPRCFPSAANSAWRANCSSPAASRRRTNRSPRSCVGASAKKPLTTLQSHCWRASTPATSTACPFGRSFHGWSTRSAHRGASSARSARCG